MAYASIVVDTIDSRLDPRVDGRDAGTPAISFSGVMNEKMLVSGVPSRIESRSTRCIGP